jgi:hypothetical protein
MAGGQGIQAGKAFVEFVLGDKKINGQLASIAGKLRKFGSIGAAATGPLLAGFAAAALTFANVGSALADTSQRTGIAVESLSELSYAAQQSGTDLGVIEKAAKNLQKKGIDPRRFDEFANSIAQIQDPVKQAQAAMETFGKASGTALLPLIRDLPALRQKARDLALTMSAEDAAAADEFGDALDTAKAQFTALAVQIGAAIAGPLTEFLVWSQGILASTIQFIHENPRLVAAIAAVAAGIAAASAAAVTFGIILAVISAHPIIAALTLIAGLALGVAVYFGLASDAAGDMKKSLDGVKMPGASPNAQLSGQAQTVQNQLRNAASGRQVQPTVAAQAAASAPVEKDRTAEIARWTRESAQELKYITKIISRTPAGVLGWL